MLPFMAECLHDNLHNILEKFVTNDAMDKATSMTEKKT